MYKKVALILGGILFVGLALAVVPPPTKILIRPGRLHPHHRRPARRRHVLRNVKAGPIMNNYDAKYKCPDVCRRASGKWTGQWHTVRYGTQSVCECRMIRVY